MWLVSVLDGKTNYKEEFQNWMQKLLDEVQKIAEKENMVLVLRVQLGVTPELITLVKDTLDIYKVDIKDSNGNKHGRLDDFLDTAKKYHMVQNEQTGRMSPHWWKVMGSRRAKDSGEDCCSVQTEKSPVFGDAGVPFHFKGDGRPLHTLIVRGFVLGVTVVCERVVVPGEGTAHKMSKLKIDFRRLVNDRNNKAADVSKRKPAFKNKKNAGTSKLCEKQKMVPADDEIPPPPPPKNIVFGARLLFDDDEGGGWTEDSHVWAGGGEGGSFRERFEGFSSHGDGGMTPCSVGEAGSYRQRFGGSSSQGGGGVTPCSVGDGEDGTMRANEGPEGGWQRQHSEVLSRDGDDGTMPAGGATSFPTGDDCMMQHAGANMQYDERDIVLDDFNEILDTFWFPICHMHDDEDVLQLFDAPVPPALPPVPAVVVPVAVASEEEGRKKRKICLNISSLRPFGEGVMGRM